MKKLGKNILIITILIVLVGIFVFKSISIKNKANNGYIAINTDRTEYLVGETVKIQITEVDNSGNLNCNANFKLTINGIEAKNISKSSLCGLSTNQGSDYSFNFKPEKTGTYELKLKDLDTKVSTTNYFDVVTERNLDIVRKMDTTINPANQKRFPVKIIITAKNDFSGEISDKVPDGITIRWQGEAKVEGNKISWQVNLKAGESKELIYEYSASDLVPTIYQFGESKNWTVITTNQQQQTQDETIQIPEIIKKLNEKNN